MNELALSEAAKGISLELSKSQLHAFALFEECLYKANLTANLTRVPKADCWCRHFLDSLILVPLIPEGAAVLDIGSGPGIPGACLAIARPDLRVSCLDSAWKPVAFMTANLGPDGRLPVLREIIHRRAEEAAHDQAYREKFDFVTGRAIAQLSIQLELSAAFAKLGGVVAPLRTPEDAKLASETNVSELGLELTDLLELPVPCLNTVRLVPVYRKSRSTPVNYPRKWAQIKRQPI